MDRNSGTGGGRAAALRGVSAALRCPVCGGAVAVDTGAVRCGQGHVFDVARQGYAALIARPLRFHGDDPAMIAARADVLDSGLYAPLLEAVAALGGGAAAAAAGAGGTALAVELGCGTGHYLAAVLRAAEDAGVRARGIGVDASKAAVKAASRAHPAGAALLGDAWGDPPLADGSVHLVMSVFAPRNAQACRRVLVPGGAVLVAAPGPEHLTELVAGLGMLHVDEDKEARLAASMRGFTAVRSERVRWRLRPDRGQAAAIAAMGPAGHHRGAGELAEAVARLPDGMPVTGDVTVRLYRRED